MSLANHFPYRPEYSEVRVSERLRVAVDSGRLATIGEQLFCLTPTGIVRIDTTTGAAIQYAGDRFPGWRDGPVATARFTRPTALVGVAGDMFVTDEGHNCIRRISGGQVTTFAGIPHDFGGRVDGPAATARFDRPMDIVAVGNVLYVLQFDANIRTIDIATGQVGTVAVNFIDIPERPWTMRDLVAHGTDLYMCAAEEQMILKLDTLTNNMTVFAGQRNVRGTKDGPRGTAKLDTPVSLTRSGNDLYCKAMFAAPTIRKINIPTGLVSTLKYSNADDELTRRSIDEIYDIVAVRNSLYAISGFYVGENDFLKIDLPSDPLPAIRAHFLAQYRNKHGTPPTPSARRQNLRKNRKSRNNRKTRKTRKSRNQ